MNRKAILKAAIVFSVLIVPVAHAQNQRQMMRELDLNGDRKVQFTELQSFRALMFDRFDTNLNGIADPDELAVLQQQAIASGRSGPANLDPQNADTNGDGVITREEFAAYLSPKMIAADRNGDQALSRRELRSLR